MNSKIPDVDTTLKYTKVALLLSGIDIFKTDQKSIVGTSLFYFHFFWVQFDNTAEINWFIQGLQSGKKIIELSLVAPCSLIAFVATAKALFLYKGRYKIIKAVQTIKQMHPNLDNVIDTENPTKRFILEKQKNICIKSIFFLRFVSLTQIIVSAVVLVAFSSLTCLSMYLEYKSSGELILKLPFLVDYYFDSSTTPQYYFFYFHQVYSTYIVLVILYGSETLFFAFCTYLQMHFDLLSVQLEYVVETERYENLEEKIVVLIRKHQILIQLTKNVEELYSKSTLINILLSSLLICLSGFNVTFNDDLEAVFSFVTFLIFSLSQISMLCYFGDRIMRASMNVSNAVFKSHWYECNPKCKKMLLLILTRAQKPCKVTAENFADINLQAFTTILSRSWSYFAVLKTMYS